MVTQTTRSDLVEEAPAGAASEIVGRGEGEHAIQGALGHRVQFLPDPAEPLALVVSGLGNILPAAPVEGLTMASKELRRRGVDPHRTRIALGLVQWLSVRVLLGVAALDALAVVALSRVSSAEQTPGRLALGAIALVVLGSLAITAWLASRSQTIELVALAGGRLRFWKPASPAADRRALGAKWHAEIHEVFGPRRNQATLASLALASCLADATCFRLALVAVGVHARPGLFLLAYSVGTIAAMVPFVPAGLGIVETVVPALLHHSGIPVPDALAGVLAYRALGTLFPALSGAIALIRLRLSALTPGAVAADRSGAARAVKGGE